MKDTRWLRRAAAALTAMLKHLRVKTVNYFITLSHFQFLDVYSSHFHTFMALVSGKHKYNNVFLSSFPAVKKKYGAGLMFSNLMNIGKKKLSSLESSEKCVDTSGELKPLYFIISG